MASRAALNAFLLMAASSRLTAPSATAMIEKRLPSFARFSMACAIFFAEYGISGMTMTSAPEAMPACSVSQPALWPMISTMNTREWEKAVEWMESMTSEAMFTADWKPKVSSVPHRSLSMVLGSVTTFTPFSRSRFAVLCVPLPPRMTRQSNPTFFTVFSILSSFVCSLSSSRRCICLNG